MGIPFMSLRPSLPRATKRGRRPESEQVRAFVEAYRKRHGRDLSFSDVRSSLGLPRSIASVYSLDHE